MPPAKPTVSVEQFEAVAERIGALEKIVGVLATAPATEGGTVDTGARKAVVHLAHHVSNDGSNIVARVGRCLHGLSPVNPPTTTTETPTA